VFDKEEKQYLMVK